MRSALKVMVTLIMLSISTFCVQAAEVMIGGEYRLRVDSLVDKRFNRIYRQKYDFSCGSATLASLLSFHYDDYVDELSVFKDMFENGDQNKIRKQGFSLLDMKHYLTRRGYESNGFNISLKQLAEARLPAITIIDNAGYMHFVLVKAQRKNEVLVGDPAVGLKVMTQNEFEAMWQGRIMFLIQSNPEIASHHYTFDKREQSRTAADLGLPIDVQRLDVLTVFAPSNWDF